MTWSCRTRRARRWPGGGCRRAWTGSPGSTSWSPSAGEDGEPDPAQVVVVIETDRGPWVKALVAAGYRVYAVNPKQAARYKETIAMSGKKDDSFDAACAGGHGAGPARHQLRPIAGDSDMAEAVKVVARAHQKLIWERTRHTAADAVGAAGVLPRRAGGLRRAGLAGPGCPGAAGRRPRTRHRRPG